MPIPLASSLATVVDKWRSSELTSSEAIAEVRKLIASWGEL